MHWPFQPNCEYSRREDIHAYYRGQQQGGIATPTGVPAIFIFTGASGVTHGYTDSFQPDGSFRYTGEGQVGDMHMRGGNKAIRDHAVNGKDLLVFEILGKGRPVRFISAFSCGGWEIESQSDRTGAMRKAIVFTLVPIESIAAHTELEALNDSPDTADLAVLRAKAYAAAATDSVPSKAATSVSFERSNDVRRYVLARAAGKCEACKAAAPFSTSKGAPYLEAHHIRRLTDGGPDHPAYVAGVCPNCHRRAHYGSDRIVFNEGLTTAVMKTEASLSLKCSPQDDKVGGPLSAICPSSPPAHR